MQKNFIQWYKWAWFFTQCWCHDFSVNNTLPHKKWIWLLSIYHSDTNWHRCWWQMLWDKYVDDRYGHLCQHFWLNYPTEVIKISTTFENCHLVCGVSDTVSAITLVQYRQFLVSQSLNSLVLCLRCSIILKRFSQNQISVSVIELSISSIIMHFFHFISMTILDDKYLPNILYHRYNISYMK